MSLPSSRYDEVCRNCKSTLQGEYCHYCGQKRIRHHDESFVHTFIHLLGDFIHFDTQVFATAIPLLFKPGFLTTEYLAGRRARYLNPIKSYVFLSFVFFFVFFMVNKKDESAVHIDADAKRVIQQINRDTISIQPAVTPQSKGVYLVNDGMYHSVAQYDSVQRKLPEAKRDGAVKQYFTRGLIRKGEELSQHPEDMLYDLSEKFAHNMPKLAFILLPVFALLLKLVYLRRNINYAAHFIFSVNMYNFFFLVASLLFPLVLVKPLSQYIPQVFFAAAASYFYFALKHVYQQGYLRTLMKMLVFSGLFLFCLVLSFIVNLMVIFFV